MVLPFCAQHFLQVINFHAFFLIFLCTVICSHLRPSAGLGCFIATMLQSYYHIAMGVDGGGPLKGTAGGLKSNISHSTIKSSSFTLRLCVPLTVFF